MTFIQKTSAYTLGLPVDKNLPDIAITGLGKNPKMPQTLKRHKYDKNDLQKTIWENN
jgi:hypothetical protein